MREKKEYLGAKEAAMFLDVKPRTVYSLLYDRKIRSEKDLKGRLIFKKEELERYKKRVDVNVPPTVEVSNTGKTNALMNKSETQILPVEQGEGGGEIALFSSAPGEEYLVFVSTFQNGSWVWIDEFTTAESVSGGQIKAMYGEGKYRLTIHRKTQGGLNFYAKHVIVIGSHPNETKERENEFILLKRRVRSLEEEMEKHKDENANLWQGLLDQLHLLEKIDKFTVHLSNEQKEMWSIVLRITQLLSPSTSYRGS